MLLPKIWICLAMVATVLIVVDLSIPRYALKAITLKSAFLLSLIWLTLSLLFAIVIYYYYGIDAAFEYLTAYTLELSLSIDNVFVFILVFQYLDIAPKYQHKILFIGVVSSIVFRLLMIPLGIYMVQAFDWLFILFGLVLLYSGYNIIRMKKDNFQHPRNNSLINYIKNRFRYSNTNENGSLFLRKNGKLFITRFFLALVMIEKADIIFALDSIAAVLAITRDPFIAFSSNIFAILGLRSIYFIIYNAVEKFKYLKHGLSYILMYIGIKMILMSFGIHIQNHISVLTIMIFLLSSFIISIISDYRKTCKHK